MSKVIVSEIVSLDGCFTGPGNNVMAMPFDDGFSQHNVELLRSAGTLLLGRTSYLEFLAHWPDVKDDPDQPEIEREISRLNSATPKVVISDSLTPAETGAWADTTRIVPRAQGRDAVRVLRGEAGGDIIVFGSHLMWNDLLEADLVDEFHLLVGPGIIGRGGVPTFNQAVPRRFTLLDVQRADGSELVCLRYAVRSPTDPARAAARLLH